MNLKRARPDLPSTIRAKNQEALIYFFAGVFAMAWLLQLVVLLASYHVVSLSTPLVLLLFGTADFAPTDVALAVTVYISGIVGAGTLLAQLGRWRVKPGWYIIAFTVPVAFVLITIGISTLFEGKHLIRWLQWPQNIGSLIVPPVGEEFGWRGFALPRLQRRYNALCSSLILGIIWACWHFPIFLLPGVSLSTFPPFLVGVTAGSILLTWLYNSTGNSLLIVMAAHAGFDLALINIPSVSGHSLLLPILMALVYCTAAVIVVLIAGPRTLCRKDRQDEKRLAFKSDTG